MIEIDIPGYKKLRLAYLVMDYNGTLACDGEPLPGVQEMLGALAGKIEAHVVTADTFGKVRSGLAGVPCKITVLPKDDQDLGKRDYIRRLGAAQVAAVGNGRNDRLMLKAAGLGIAVILQEGTCAETVRAADVVCTSIRSALELLSHPLRLVATLRS